MIEDSALDDVTGKNRSIAVLSRCISDHPDFTQSAFLDNRMNSAAKPGPNNRRELSIYFFLNAEYRERDGGVMQVVRWCTQCAALRAALPVLQSPSREA